MPLLVPAQPSAWIRRGFEKRILAPMIRKSWHAVRLAGDTGDQALRDLATHTGPAIIAMNHHAWWDPMIGMWLAATYLPGRPGYAPMQADQLAKFAILKKLGVFGVDPDNPASLQAMVDYLRQRWAAEPSAALWITPQGQFCDIREPIRIRPGISAIAASLPVPPRVVSITSEMVFWTEKQPELLLRAVTIDPPALPTTAAWHRVITRAMQANADALATLARKRDPDAFTTIGGRNASSTNPFYDLWLKLTGRANTITPTHRGGSSPRHSPTPRSTHTP
jgi:1-acyl-sn-glycerol-3-phosphate acyltransferase